MNAVCTVMMFAWGALATFTGTDVTSSARNTVPARGAAPRHFEDISGNLPSIPITTVAVSPHDPADLYAGTDGFLWASDDGGETWRAVLSFPRGIAIDDTDLDVADVTADAADTLFDDVPGRGFGSAPDGMLSQEADDMPDGAIDGDAGSMQLPDGFVFGQYDNTNAPMPEGDLTDQIVDHTLVARTGAGVRRVAFVPRMSEAFYVATPRGLFRTRTAGQSFDRVEVPGGMRENDVRDVVVDPVETSRILVATAAGLFVSSDHGATLVRIAGRVGHAPITALAVERMPDGVVVVVGTERGLFRSFDGAATFFEVLLRGAPPFSPVAAVAIDPAENTVYAGTGQGLFVGEHGAALLERYGDFPDGVVQALSSDPFRRRGVAIGTRTRGMFFSSDAGITAEQNAEQVPASEVFAIARTTTLDDVLVATDRGVFRSTPGLGVAMTAHGLARLQGRMDGEPRLDDVARAAVRWSRFGGDVLSDIRARAALAPWLPGVVMRYVQVQGRTSRRDEFLLRARDELPPFVDPANDTRDLFGNVGAFVLQPTLGAQHALWVQLRWDLDKTVLSDAEVVALRQGPAWWAAERSVLERVRTLWVARRRLLVETFQAEGRGTRGISAALERQLRIDELTALLDAATGGAFSAALESGVDALSGDGSARLRARNSTTFMEDE